MHTLRPALPARQERPGLARARSRSTDAQVDRPKRSSRGTRRRHPDTLDLGDIAQVKVWAFLVEDAIDDMLAAGDEATLSRSDRVISRAEARRQLFEAWTKAMQLLGALQRGAR